MSKRYTKEHEWISVDGDIATIGITDHAQEQLGDVVFVELPAVGKAVTKGGDAAVVESVKAASEVYAPVSGEVVEVNKELEGDPAMVNRDAEGGAWFMKVKMSNPAEFDALMTRADYDKMVGAYLVPPCAAGAGRVPRVSEAGGASRPLPPPGRFAATLPASRGGIRVAK